MYMYVYIYIYFIVSTFIYSSAFTVQPDTENTVSYRSLITIFSATLIGLKTLPNDESTQHGV
jgi:hypothetical protein